MSSLRGRVPPRSGAVLLIPRALWFAALGAFAMVVPRSHRFLAAPDAR